MVISFSVPFLRRAESFGSPKYQRLSSSKSGSGLLLGTSLVIEPGTKTIFTFCGFLALEILLVVFLFTHRTAFTIGRGCRLHAPPAAQLRFPPSAWYYEHVYDYPLPKLRILTHKDGAQPIRSKILPREKDITIATHTTADRLPAVKMTALRWSGTMVVAVLVKVRSEIPIVYKALQELHTIVEAEGRCRLSIQFIFEDGFEDDDEALRALYPVNGMRNHVLRMVTTELVLLIDADFVPSPGLHEHLTQQEDKYGDYFQRCTEEKHVLVIPSFQMTQDKSIPYRESLHALPHSKEELREAWWNGIVDCFQCDVVPAAHSATDYPRFIDPAVDYPYDVTYREGYEPFFIANADKLPHYDARFRGYAMNKVSHVYLMAAMGMGFTVIPEGFLVELPHLPSLSQRAYSGHHREPLQKWRIDALYRRFKAEVQKELNVTEVPIRHFVPFEE